MSNAEAALASKISEVPPGSFRQTVLLAAKRFKSSWVELGKLLVKVRNEALFEQWGYPSFEAYCLAEVRIKRQTAEKLTRSFSFLDKHEPKAMAQDDIVETAPAFEVVQVLADAEERGQLSAQEYRSIRDSIWNNDRPVSELKRELVEQFPSPESKGPTDAAQLKRLAAWARKLATELHGNKKVPRAMAERAEALAEEVEELSLNKAEA
ncbi:MAG: hypothetical protein H6Q89_935 [Myxococcaceae bacterium]|nr:hypothetical protein [Myxococcaceae bacterium]